MVRRRRSHSPWSNHCHGAQCSVRQCEAVCSWVSPVAACSFPRCVIVGWHCGVTVTVACLTRRAMCCCHCCEHRRAGGHQWERRQQQRAAGHGFASASGGHPGQPGWCWKQQRLQRGRRDIMCRFGRDVPAGADASCAGVWCECVCAQGMSASPWPRPRGHMPLTGVVASPLWVVTRKLTGPVHALAVGHVQLLRCHAPSIHDGRTCVAAACGASVCGACVWWLCGCVGQ